MSPKYKRLHYIIIGCVEHARDLEKLRKGENCPSISPVGTERKQEPDLVHVGYFASVEMLP